MQNCMQGTPLYSTFIIVSLLQENLVRQLVIMLVHIFALLILRLTQSLAKQRTV